MQEISRSLTIQQFCEAEGISLSQYYKMRRSGYGPDEMHVPNSDLVRIAPAAHQAWRERMTALAKSKSSQLERKRRADARTSTRRRAAAAPSVGKRKRAKATS